MIDSVSIYDPNAITVVTLTPAAITHVKKMLAKELGSKGLRLSVKKSGCSGFAYVVDYAKEINPNDLNVLVAEGLTVFVDTDSLPYLKGIRVDYVRNGLNGVLKFINPNEKGSCGCGESFTI